MTQIENLISGVIIGFTASVPLGPIGALCIQKTINKGQLAGFIGGLGAAFSDTIYAIIAGFGISFIIDFIFDYQIYMRIIAAGVLFFLGLKMFFTDIVKQKRKQKLKKSKGLFGDFIATFAYTFSNPLALIFFLGAFAAFGVVKGEGNSVMTVIMLTSGVLIGASFWWFILTFTVNLFRKKFKLRLIWWINKITGIIIVIFAILALLSIFFLSDNYVQESIR
ncbi:MAG: LysE family transporter [Marinilabiliales bacterium]